MDILLTKDILEYRRNVLEYLDVTYDTEDITDFEKWREKVLEGLLGIKGVTKEELEKALPSIVNEWLLEHPEITTTIQDGEVTTPKLADYSVTSLKIADNSLYGRHFRESTITENILVNGAVTENKLRNSAVTTSKIADEAVTEDKLSDEVKSKLNSDSYKVNLLDTVDLVKECSNCVRMDDGVWLDYRYNSLEPDVDRNVDVYFALFLAETLKAGKTYALSFDVKGIPGTYANQLKFRVYGATGDDTILTNGRNTIVFTPSSDKFPYITVDDNNTVSERPRNTDIYLTNFMLVEGDEGFEYDPLGVSALEGLRNLHKNYTTHRKTIEEIGKRATKPSGSTWAFDIEDDTFASASTLVGITTTNKVIEVQAGEEYKTGILYAPTIEVGGTQYSVPTMRLSKTNFKRLPFAMKYPVVTGNCDRSGRYITNVNLTGANEAAAGFSFRLGDPSNTFAVDPYDTSVWFSVKGTLVRPPAHPSIAYNSTIGQQIVNVAKTYTQAVRSGRKISYGQNFFYQTNDTINDDSGAGKMECDTFAGLVLRGVTYENSPYADTTPGKTMSYEEMMTRTAQLDLPSWATNLRAKFHDETFAEYYKNDSSDRTKYETRFASDMAWMFWMIPGTLYTDISHVSPGDVAFWRDPIRSVYFDSITHVAIVGDNYDIYEVTGRERSNGRILHNISINKLVDHMPSYFARPYGF